MQSQQPDFPLQAMPPPACLAHRGLYGNGDIAAKTGCPMPRLDASPRRSLNGRRRGPFHRRKRKHVRGLVLFPESAVHLPDFRIGNQRHGKAAWQTRCFGQALEKYFQSRQGQPGPALSVLHNSGLFLIDLHGVSADHAMGAEALSEGTSASSPSPSMPGSSGSCRGVFSFVCSSYA